MRSDKLLRSHHADASLAATLTWITDLNRHGLAVFDYKLLSRGRPMGVFVAAAGITGTRRPGPQPTRSSPMRSHKREIIVVTRHELDAPTDTDELVLLLKQKRALLAVSVTIFEVSPGRRRA